MSNEKEVRHYINEETGMVEEVEILEHVDYSSYNDTHRLIGIQEIEDIYKDIYSVVAPEYRSVMTPHPFQWESEAKRLESFATYNGLGYAKCVLTHAKKSK